MIASVIRRFAIAAPRLNPPAASISKPTSSMSLSSKSRVAMMPGAKQSTDSGMDASGTRSIQAQAEAPPSTEFDDVLTIGGVSSHCDGQKISRAAEGSI